MKLNWYYKTLSGLTFLIIAYMLYLSKFEINLYSLGLVFLLVVIGLGPNIESLNILGMQVKKVKELGKKFENFNQMIMKTVLNQKIIVVNQPTIPKSFEYLGLDETQINFQLKERKKKKRKNGKSKNR